MSEIQADYISVFTEFDLTRNEIEIYSIKALMGDCDAALRLADYYEFLTHNNECIYFWLLIGAENGSSVLQSRLAYNMLNVENIRDRKERSVYWIEKSGVEDISTFKEIWFKSFDDTCVEDKKFKDFWKNKQVPLSLLMDKIINRIKQNALLGKNNDSYKLSTYYLNNKNDKKEAIYWSRIGAQNENEKCQYEYGKYLLIKNDEYSKIRGLFWIRKAINNGSAEAEILLNEIRENED